MKILMLVILSVGCGCAHAKSKVDFERETASSKTQDGLSLAFQDAVKGSDADLKSTKSVVMVEEKARLAKWSYGQNKKAIVIQATAAVDSSNIMEVPKNRVRDSQIETDKSIEKDLTELH